MLAWHNAAENGWDPTDLGVDEKIVNDIVSMLQLLREWHVYPEDFGFRNLSADALERLTDLSVNSFGIGSFQRCSGFLRSAQLESSQPFKGAQCTR